MAERRPVMARLFGRLFEVQVGEIQEMEVAGSVRVIAYPAFEGVGTLHPNRESAERWLVLRAEQKEERAA